MKHPLLALLLAYSCATNATRPPELDQTPAPAPPPPAPVPVPSAPTTHCPGYCAQVDRCVPAYAYPECPADCVALLSDPVQSAVSGLTPAVVRCWAEAPSCDLALECDAAK
jgi:hypothetical protein